MYQKKKLNLNSLYNLPSPNLFDIMVGYIVTPYQAIILKLKVYLPKSNMFFGNRKKLYKKKLNQERKK